MASLARTILEDHLERGELVPGQEIALRVDQTLAQDATGTMAMMQLESFGVERVQVETAVVYVDHNILQIDFKNPDDHRFLQAMSARYGAWFSRPGNGICHYVHCERFAKPGQTLVGADSHTTQSGSCAMIAIGAGGLDVAVCMAGHAFELPCPKIVGVFLENELQRPWIQAKDVILELLRRRGVRGGRGAIFEFTGPGVASLSYTERGTIANMIAELGATGAVFPADDETRAWMTEQQREDDFTELPTGDTGDFDEEEHIDLAELVPLVATPSSPGNVVPVEEVAGTELTQVCIGSSVNSSYADLALCGAVMRGSSALGEARLRNRHAGLAPDPRPDHALGHLRRPADGGSADARACLRPLRGHGPGASVGVELASHLQPQLPRPQRHGRRSGLPLLARGRRGLDAHRRDLRSARAAGGRRSRAPAGSSRGRPGPHPRAGADRRGPLDRGSPRPEHQAAARGAAAAGGTEDAGADQGAGRHLDRRPLARRRDRDGVPLERARDRRVHLPAPRSGVPRRAHEWGGGFIVAGHNYGQGSSREHAALAPLQLGVRVVIAKSFARIHRRNLIAQGIVPLLFKDENDYDKAELGQTWRITGLREIADGEDDLETEIEGADTITLTHDLLPREREIVVAGGLIRYLREQQPAPA